MIIISEKCQGMCCFFIKKNKPNGNFVKLKIKFVVIYT